MERKSLTHKCLIATTLLLAVPAKAQNTMFYGPSGQYEGSALTIGSITSYYGTSGQYLGNASTINDTTSYYDSTGGYEGNSLGPAIAAPYGE